MGETTKILDKNTEKLDGSTKNHFKIISQHDKSTIANTESASNSVEKTIETNDDLKLLIYKLEIKQEVDVEFINTYVNQPVEEESVRYEDTTTATIKEESVNEEIFEDDIILLTDNNTFSTIDIKQELADEVSLVSSEGNISTKDFEFVSRNKKAERSVEASPQPSTSKSRRSARRRKCHRCGFVGSSKSFVQHTSYCVHPYRCTKCDRTFKSLNAYVWHFQKHGNRVNSCPECDMVYSNNTNLVIHIKMHIKNSYRKQNVLTNESKMDVSINYICITCNEIVDVELLFEHWEGHIELSPGIIDTNEVKEEADDREALLFEHWEGHIKPSPGIIDNIKVKEEADDREAFLFEHWEGHIKPSPGIIDNIKVKEEADDREALLFEHWEGHIKPSPGIIDNIKVKEEADDREAFAGSLSRDVISDIKKALLLQKDHFTNMQKLCYVCDRSFKMNNDFKRHLIEHLLSDAMSRHAAYNAIKCHFCDHTMFKSFSFRLHIRDHAGLPVYRCGLCRKAFSDSSSLAKHKKNHDNTTTLQCDICKKKFHSNVLLIKHIQIHESTKPIVCKCCDKAFHEQSSYRRHQRNVDSYKAKGFPCQICKHKFFRLKDNLEHMWEIHKQSKYQANCPICQKPFRNKIDVKRHIKSDHHGYVSLLEASILERMFGSESIKDLKILMKEEPDKMFVVSEND